MVTKDLIVDTLLARHGETFCSEAGFELADKPKPLFQLLVLATLCGAPVRASVAIEGARALFAAGWTTPAALTGVTTARRAKVLREAGYARFIGRAATVLGASARALRDEHDGDLRALRAHAAGDRAMLRKSLKSFDGIGDTAVDVFFAEAQGVWDEVAPSAGERALTAARALGLGSSPQALTRMDVDLPTLVAALTRCALADDAADIKAEARAAARV